jgi:hypothetical protein
MFTIAETTAFSSIWPNYWTAEELGEFCVWLALNPEGGEVIPGSGGWRKVRWGVGGRGKGGGVRVIWVNRLTNGIIWLMTMYGKNVRANVDARVLVKIMETLNGKAERKGAGKVRGRP